MSDRLSAREVKRHKWWGWGLDDVTFRYDNKPAFAPLARNKVGVDLESKQPVEPQLSDFEVPVDAQGFFTLVVSDPAQKPANATDANAIAWLPWGSIYPDSVVIYRHMLPSPHFTQAVQNVAYGTPPVDVMGDYLPRIAYCDQATIEAAGSAAQAFEDCAAK